MESEDSYKEGGLCSGNGVEMRYGKFLRRKLKERHIMLRKRTEFSLEVLSNFMSVFMRLLTMTKQRNGHQDNESKEHVEGKIYYNNSKLCIS